MLTGLNKYTFQCSATASHLRQSWTEAVSSTRPSISGGQGWGHAFV